MNENIKQDINFLEYPLWAQSAVTDGKKEVAVWESGNGYKFESVMGVPGKVDIMILYYLLLKIQNENLNDTIITTQYNVLNGCGLGKGSKNKERLKKSLEIWKRVTISFSGIFFTGVDYQKMEFGIIDAWKIRKDDGKLQIRFNSDWLETIKNSGFFKYISFEQMKSLRSPLALRLYEILMKSFYKRIKWEIDVLKLANKIPMSEKHVAHIVPKIEAATKRINEQTDLNVEVKTIKIERGKGKFIFTLQNSSTIDAVKEHNTTDKKQKRQTKSGLEKVKVTTEDIKKSRDSNILNDLRKQTDEYLNDLVNIGSKNAKIVLNERRLTHSV